MKKLISAAMATVISVSAAAVYVPQTKTYADNPAIQTIYSTDPAPMVYNDTVYLYTGRDKDGSKNYYMPDWHCYSSTDMQNWTDHGMILSWDSFTWGKEDSAWAAQCIERNGKFYYYVTLECKNGGGRGIGVAVADSPTGPFKDALGKPLCGPNWEYIDPTVFIDDDGQAWLMFGNPTCHYVKLNEDMISYSGDVGSFEMNSSSFGPSSKKSSYGEGPWFYKRGRLYYLVFAAFYGSDGGESLGYSTAPSPTGPWTYGGQVMKTHNCFTNHPGVIDYKGKSYLFYHDASLPGGGSFTRSVCVDEFEYGADGSIPTITPTKEGPQQLESLDPFKKTEAETICFSNGVKTENCSEGGMNVANIEKGDYIKVKGVDFGEGADKFTASVASNTDGGTIELHIDSTTGPVIGTCKVSGTGGWQEWNEVSTDVVVDGEHDLYFVFNGGSGYLLNMDWWQFSGPGGSSEIIPDDPDPESYILHNTFEKGVEGWEARFGAKVAVNSSTSFQGKKALKVTERSENWTGAIKKLDSKFKPGSAYSFSINAMTDQANKTETFYFTLQYNDSEGTAHYDKIATVNAVNGKWVQLANPSFTIPSGAEDIYMYVETASGTNDFYIDDAVIAEKGTVISGAVGGKLTPADINSDGIVDVFDAVLARKGLADGFKDDIAALAADVDNSGQYETNDLVLINNFLNGTITEFPDNTPEPEPSTFEYKSALAYSAAPGEYLDPCSQAGKIVKESYTGINGNKSLNVYLPYGYDSSKKYNIFYLMHGGGENENTIFSNDVKLQNILDHMIMNGELEPLIVVTPTFNGCPAPDNNMGAGTVWDEMRQSVIPFVEGKYSTYAKSTSIDDLKASRYHRAYGGFSMGGGSTWNMLINNLDICAYYMPLSGHCWGGLTAIQNAIDKFGYSKDEYYILAATGDKDLAYNNMLGLINPLKQDTKHFTDTSDFSKGNFYFLVAPGQTHWWGVVRYYVYDALPYFFHEHQ